MDIHIERLSIAYDAQRVINDLQLHIPSGSFFTLLGPSGCGKTTLLRTIAGFIPVHEGRLRFGEREVTHLPAHQRDIGMVFQDYALFPNRTVHENVAYGLRARNVAEADIKRRVAAALERVGLQGFAERLPAALSGGQRQRVALARAMVIQPAVLLMDEPLSNLDAKLRVQVRETIAELQRESGITTVFVTHDQEEALAMSSHIAVMNKGRIEQLGSPREIYEEPASAYVADFVGAANLLPARCPAQPAGLVELQVAGNTLRARAPRSLAGDAVLVARPEHVTLDAPQSSSAPGTGHAAPGPSGHAAPSLSGRIRSVQYLGVKTSYRVALSGVEQLLTVERHGHGHRAWAAGDEVQVRLDPERCLALVA